MSTNGQLNGSRNGNGALNGNGSGQTEPKRRRLTNFWSSDAPHLILVYSSLAVLISGLTLWNRFHPQPQSLPDPRTVQIEKTIEQLYDAIDVLKDELPPEPEPDNDPR